MSISAALMTLENECRAAGVTWLEVLIGLAPADSNERPFDGAPSTVTVSISKKEKAGADPCDVRTYSGRGSGLNMLKALESMSGSMNAATKNSEVILDLIK